MRGRSLRRRLGFALAVTGLVAATVAEAAPDISQPPEDDLKTSLAAGGRALAAGDLEAASAAFQAARHQGETSPLPWLGLAEVAERRGELIESLKLARGALERAPQNVDVLKVISRLQIRLGAPREALENLAEVRRLVPSDPAGFLTAAAILRDVERLGEAIDLLQSAGIESPEIPSQLGLLLIEGGRGGEALEVAQVALERWPEHAGLELVMGLGLLTEARRAEAAPWLERALAHGAPGEGRIQLALGEAKLDGCSEVSIEHFERAVELMPRLPEAHYKLALGLRACRRMEEARDALARFQELSGTAEKADHKRRESGAALNEVQQMAAAGELDAALAKLDALAAESPGDDRIHTLRGKLQFSAGRATEALESVRRAQALMPSRVEGHYLEGLFLSQAGELEMAAEALDRALAIDPDRPDVLKLRGAIYAEQGDLESAAGHFEKVIAGGNGDAAAHFAYAKVLEALGKTAESLEQMELFRKLRGD